MEEKDDPNDQMIHTLFFEKIELPKSLGIREGLKKVIFHFCVWIFPPLENDNMHQLTPPSSKNNALFL